MYEIREEGYEHRGFKLGQMTNNGKINKELLIKIRNLKNQLIKEREESENVIK